MQYFEDLSTWFTPTISAKYIEQNPQTSAPPAAAGTAATTTAAPTGPKDKGWVVELTCYHFFNSDRRTEGIAHALNTIVNNLKNGSVVIPVEVGKLQPGVVVRHQVVTEGKPPTFVDLNVKSMTPVVQGDPDASDSRTVGYNVELAGVEQPIQFAINQKAPVVFTMAEMGIDYPVIVSSSRINRTYQVPNPNFDPGEAGGYGSGSGGMGGSGPGGMGGSGPGMGGMGMGGSGMGGAGMLGSGGGSMGPSGGGTTGKDDEKEPQRTANLGRSAIRLYRAVRVDRDNAFGTPGSPSENMANPEKRPQYSTRLRCRSGCQPEGRRVNHGSS